MNWTLFWAIVAIAALVVELITFGLTSIWLTGGALVSLVLSLLDVAWPIQIATFFIVSIILLIITRPLAKKFINDKKIPTNYEEAIGKSVRVTEAIDNNHNTGRAFFNGVDWAARSVSDEINFEVDEMARVVRVEGVKLILEKIESQE